MANLPAVVFGPDGLPRNIQPGDGLISGVLAAGPHLLGLPNGNFEDAVGTPGSAGSYPRGWTATATGTGSTVLDTTAANKLTGANSVKMVLAASGDTVTYTGGVFPCGAGIPFYAYLRAKSSGQAARLTVTINYFTNNGATANGSATLAQVTGLPTVYAEYGGIATPPAGTSYAQIAWRVDTAADTVWVDEVRPGRATLSSDSSFKAPATGGVLRWLVNKLFDVIDVADFGAVNDNATDSTAAIQAAVNAAQARGGGIVWVRGNYVVSAAIVISSFGVIIQGEGAGYTHSTIRTTSKTDDVIRIAGTGANGQCMKSGVRDLHITATGITKTAGAGVYLSNCFGGFVEGCLLEYMYIGVRDVGSAVSVIARNLIYNSLPSTGIGISLEGSAVGTFISQNSMDGGPSSTQPQCGVQILGGCNGQCILSNNIARYAVCGYVSADSGDVVNLFFSMNAWDSSLNGAGLQMSAQAGHNIYSVMITGEWAASNGSNGFVFNTNGTGTIDSVQLTGCTAVNNGQQGMYFNGNMANFHISNPTVAGNSQQGVNAYFGIDIGVNVSHWTITGGCSRPTRNFANTQHGGLRIQNGSSDYYTVIGGDYSGNYSSPGVSDGGSGTHKSITVVQ